MSRRTGCVLGVLLGLSGPVAAQPTADSLAEFSGVQGQQGWRYGYYDAGADPVAGYDPLVDFELFGDGQFTGTVWRFSGSGAATTTLTAVGGAPNGADHEGGVQWAVRRWTADVGGRLRIDGSFGELDARGGGTIGRIFVDGVQVFSRAESQSPRPFSVEVLAVPGSTVDFAIDPNGDGLFDLARFDAVITRLPCDADLDANGLIDVFDLLAYLDGWFSGDADFNGDGVTEPWDLVQFVTAWLGGYAQC